MDVYELSVDLKPGVRDVDFAGDRSFVYRLSLSQGPRVLSAIPAAGKSGETREVEFLVDAGNKRETIKKRETDRETRAAVKSRGR